MTAGFTKWMMTAGLAIGALISVQAGAVRRSSSVVTTVIPTNTAIVRDPARISQVVPVGDNRFLFGVRGQTGDTVIVENSIDLVNWTYFGSFTATNSDPVYFGPWQADEMARFFRTRSNAP